MADATIAAGVQRPNANKLEVTSAGSFVLGDLTITVDASGNVIFTGLPTADPAVAGALYTSTGALKVSAG